MNAATDTTDTATKAASTGGPGAAACEEQSNLGLTERVDVLVNYLYGQASRHDSREALIHMRASLGARGGIAPQAVVHVARAAPAPNPRLTGPAKRRRDAQERATYLVAGLFSLWHVGHSVSRSADRPPGRSGNSVGRALKALAGTDKVGAEALLGVLTRQPQDQIANPAQRMVAVLAQRGIRLDWQQLAFDLMGSPARYREAQRRWAADFYTR